MAATGSNHKERHLAQPPRGFRNTAPGGGGLHFPIWVAAVLLVVALSLLIFPMARGEAATLPDGITASASDSVIVPILFPLEARVSWTDTFGAARGSSRTHQGNDMMAPKMTPVLAVVDGKVDWLNLDGERSSYNNQPYYNILLRGDDGNDYFYIHLNNDTPGTDDGQGGVEHAYAPGLTDGMHVKMGDVIGYVGDSGNAEDVDSHLHFEIHLGGYVSATSGQSRCPSAIDPYASLKAAPTLAEWVAAGKPPLTSMTTIPDPGTTTTTTISHPTTTTTEPDPPVTTTTKHPVTPPTSTGTPVPGFTDVLTSDWFYEDFALALDAGVVIESPDGRFRPYSKVSRALFAVYLVRTMAPSQLGNVSSAAAGQPTFEDVDAEYWAYEEIELAARLGLVQGTGDGSTYSPESKVTRAQMATMICRAMGLDVNGEWVGSAVGERLYEDIPPDYWAHGAIFVVDYYGLMCGDANGCFRPLDDTTRAQAITVMARILRLLEGG